MLARRLGECGCELRALTGEVSAFGAYHQSWFRRVIDPNRLPFIFAFYLIPIPAGFGVIQIGVRNPTLHFILDLGAYSTRTFRRNGRLNRPA